MSLPAYIVIALAIFLAGAGGGIKWEKGQQAVRDVAALEHAREVRMQRENAVDVASAGHEKDKRAIEVRYRVITNEVNHVVQSDFYASGAPVCLDDAGLRQLSRAIRANEAASEPARVVPGSRAAP